MVVGWLGDWVGLGGLAGWLCWFAGMGKVIGFDIYIYIYMQIV